MRTLMLSISCFLFSNAAIAQADSNSIFLRSKGLLEYPINTNIEAKDMSIGTRLCGDFPQQKVSFFSDSSTKVNCIFDGEVIMTAKIEDMYLVIAKFGDYFLTYVNLSKLMVKKGDYIKAGQTIAYLQKDFDDIFTIDIYLSSNEKQLNPYPWFKKIKNNKECDTLILQYE